MATARNDNGRCSQCGEDLAPRAKACRNCGCKIGASGDKPKEKHLPATCHLCGKEGITAKTVWPLRQQSQDGNDWLAWAHDACRHPTTALAVRCDRLARGVEIHPDPMAAALISAARDMTDKDATKADRRDLMATIGQWMKSTQRLPYDPSRRLAEDAS